MPNNLKLVEDHNEILYELSKDLNIQIPAMLKDLSIYKKIEDFKDAEYIYCIAYEMLIRTDEYKSLIKEYVPLKDTSKDNMTNDEFSKLRELIDKMNDLGLKKTSFLGFDCDDDHDHVFKRIEYYNEVRDTPWSVRMLHKFELDSNENIFYKLASFYFDKDELYTFANEQYLKVKETIISCIKNKSQYKTQDECNQFYKLLDICYIPCIERKTNNTIFKSLSSNEIYLSELNKDFLSLLQEKSTNDLLIQPKSDFSSYNTSFWDKYHVKDIKNGLNKLIDFHISNNLIFDHNAKNSDASISYILKNLSNFYIPCVERLTLPDEVKFNIKSAPTLDYQFIKQLELNGLKSMFSNIGSIKLNIEGKIYLIQISEYISLGLLDDSFLKTLNYEDLKNIYINTDPKFSRPRLMFDEARLTNIPINLNLSKEDLLLYIAKIKDDYDENKNIVKTDIEHFFDLDIESDKAEMPVNIKFVDEKKKRKRHNVSNRQELKKELSMAFYIYDIYKFLLPHQDKLENDIIVEIIKLFDYQTSVEQLEEKIKTYLNIMKEFIHGVNKINENNVLKIKYYENNDKYEPKYKNLIIGKSYIAKSNYPELKKNLGL